MSGQVELEITGSGKNIKAQSKDLANNPGDRRNGVHIPGRSAASDRAIELPAALVATLEAYLKSAWPLLR
ncbi:hypothetical protein ACMDCR_17400 [Labrys okinawensis]|uniref:hypothetical protein n=1 Tax=Labrys okinawensis TaxID=346911 RepID=UPI0039BC9468